MNIDGNRLRDVKREIRARSHDGIERRTVTLTGVEVRAVGDDGGYTLSGHAAVFNDLSEDLGYFESWYERIDPGAFAAVLRSKPDVRALFNHDPNLVLARTTNGTLRLREDDVGLFFEADVAATTYGADLRVLIERGDVSQCSFAFRVGGEGSSFTQDESSGEIIRTIHQFSELYDVSPVTYPAYPTTDVGLAANDLEGEDAERSADAPDACTGAEGCPACDNPADCPQGTSNAENEGPAPEGERHDDEPARQRDVDGPDEERHADETPADDDTAWRLSLAQRRLRLREQMGDTPN